MQRQEDSGLNLKNIVAKRIHRIEEANMAEGHNSINCCLIIGCGLAAKTLAISGLVEVYSH